MEDLKAFTSELLGELVAVRCESSKPGATILLPDWQRSLFGWVVSCGPEATDVKRGDYVTFGAASGMESVYSGIAIRVMRQSDILGIVEE